MKCQRVLNQTPYLEPQHIRRIANGGPDHPRRVAALCPNCHTYIHDGEDGDVDNRALADKLATWEHGSVTPHSSGGAAKANRAHAANDDRATPKDSPQPVRRTTRMVTRKARTVLSLWLRRSVVPKHTLPRNVRRVKEGIRTPDPRIHNPVL